VIVGVVRQWWAPGGFLAFRAATLALRLDLREGMVDQRNLTKRFVWLSDIDEDYAYEHRSPPWGCLHGSSPVPRGLQVKT
jgi:hypothetical protein